MGKILLTSDMHFGHRKPFIYEPRGYKTVEEMNEDLIVKWNTVVSDYDTVYVLGDLMLGDNDEGLKCLNRLNGHKVVIYGNHDTDARRQLYRTDFDGLLRAEDAMTLKYGGYHFFLCHYPCMTGNFDYDKPLKQRLISLCGHTHTQDRWHDWVQGPIYHVEVDAHDGYPVELDQIIAEIEAKVRERKEML